MASIMQLLPAVAQGWRAGTQWHSPAPLYHGWTRRCSHSPRSNVHLNSPAPVRVRQGLWCGPCRVSPSTSLPWPGGAALNGFPCLRFLCGGKKTHILITTGSLVVALREGIPTCDWGRETGGGMCEISVWEGCRLGSGSERQRERASCRSNITYGPAGWEGLPNMIHMCYILSEPLPGSVVLGRGMKEGGAVCVCPLCPCVRTAGERSCHVMIF